MNKVFRIGTRESQLAVWQATQVQNLLSQRGFAAELVYIKSEGDIDLKTPLYEMGVQGIFTRSLDIALLTDRIDIAVHSMKDVPTQLPAGITTAAVLKRASYKDLLVYKGELPEILNEGRNNASHSPLTIATSSIRRKAQWLNRYPHHTIDNLRGNVNTRLKKLAESPWNGAIFAAAGLERIGLRPEQSIELDWMLPAPAQGAIVVACRSNDQVAFDACQLFNDEHTAICTAIERDFLRALLGGCSTPISALATIMNDQVHFEGNILSLDGKEKATIEKTIAINNSNNLGSIAAKELLQNGGQEIADQIRHGK
ncbi:hydroxymethylbilane synthase [Niastella yeongjuensis]|uniref:Hydroxymethylbilane synthase n=1 Tax=Niastella yeongjuensis TaxID=354355 RepID=A0A1V9EMG4_9BACT|nr:hydroxymethylbilane synthase [Niastella yeongjuensis]OQP47055.1 hydroxymethylbilane synthase [Niastella yeongjuensis]SEN67488.1 hydroxymethylbilane synthase [Niastella yeongjuensis]